MIRWSLLALPILMVAACAAPQPVSRRPSPPVAAAPAPVPLAVRVRQEAWLTRFWEQLTPSQRRRVLARLSRGPSPLASTPAEAAPLWDGLGLPERNALVFGRGLPAPVQARLAQPEPTPVGPTLAASP